MPREDKSKAAARARRQEARHKLMGAIKLEAVSAEPLRLRDMKTGATYRPDPEGRALLIKEDSGQQLIIAEVWAVPYSDEVWATVVEGLKKPE